MIIGFVKLVGKGKIHPFIQHAARGSVFELINISNVYKAFTAMRSNLLVCSYGHVVGSAIVLHIFE